MQQTHNKMIGILQVMDSRIRKLPLITRQFLPQYNQQNSHVSGSDLPSKRIITIGNQNTNKEREGRNKKVE
jgi:hypothetical protein